MMKAPSTRVAQMVKCHYCNREYFVPTAELDKYTAQLEAENDELKVVIAKHLLQGLDIKHYTYNQETKEWE